MHPCSYRLPSWQARDRLGRRRPAAKMAARQIRPKAQRVGRARSPLRAGATRTGPAYWVESCFCAPLGARLRAGNLLVREKHPVDSASGVQRTARPTSDRVLTKQNPQGKCGWCSLVAARLAPQKAVRTARQIPRWKATLRPSQLPSAVRPAPNSGRHGSHPSNRTESGAGAPRSKNFYYNPSHRRRRE